VRAVSAEDAAHQGNELLRVAPEPPVPAGRLYQVGPGPFGQPGRRSPEPGVTVLLAHQHGERHPAGSYAIPVGNERGERWHLDLEEHRARRAVAAQGWPY
jgi:hypothetical protein